jgi:hypothetical protein
MNKIIFTMLQQNNKHEFPKNRVFDLEHSRDPRARTPHPARTPGELPDFLFGHSPRRISEYLCSNIYEKNFFFLKMNFGKF